MTYGTPVLSEYCYTRTVTGGPQPYGRVVGRCSDKPPARGEARSIHFRTVPLKGRQQGAPTQLPDLCSPVSRRR